MKYKWSIIAFITTFIWWYLMGCFMNVNINIAEWGWDCRVSISLFGTLSAFILACVVFIKQNKRYL